MTYRPASAPARPVARTLAIVAALAAFSAAGSVPVSAQQTQKAAPKGQQKGGAPAANPPAAAPAAPGQPGQQSGEVPPLIYSNWTKVCGKEPAQGNKQICQTGKDGRLESGVPVIAAILIEMDGEQKKVLQVVLPPGVYLPKGTRAIIDQDEPSAMVGAFLTCANGGCVAQLEATADTVAKMKKGKTLYVQAYGLAQNIMTLSLPLADFAKAYDGAPTDPKDLAEKTEKLKDELQRRANEQRQKLEGGKTQ